MGSVPVPVTKRQLVTPGRVAGRELEVMEGIELLRPHLKPNLTAAEEARLRMVVGGIRSQIRQKWRHNNRHFERIHGSWLDTFVKVPTSLVFPVHNLEGKCSNCLAPLQENCRTKSQSQAQVSEAFEIVFEGFLKRNAQVCPMSILDAIANSCSYAL
jgi:hypothetical protein